MSAAILLSIQGKVQGVGYRAWARREARKHGVRGWVRNRGDGSVEALIIGDEPAVAAMAAACRRGPLWAQVIEVSESAAADDGCVDFSESPDA
ncbi:MAG TPA: acylphosphatase [Stellaceae bacterium]|jgi:acylphosphatase|nr:acylphosphatase [Stellaceae bacterium]